VVDLPSRFRNLSTHSLLQAEDSGAEGPLLWAVQELASPLEARLRHHFASGLPTDRLDRPEWLFTTALRVAREAGPQLAPLQPALSVPTPGLLYDIQASGAVCGVETCVGLHACRTCRELSCRWHILFITQCQ